MIKNKLLGEVLTPENVQAHLAPPLLPPSGDELQESLFSSSRFSNWFGNQVEEILFKNPLWNQAQPIILGSWARGELCPKSDIDVLFCGDDETVKKLTDDLILRNIKLRYRVPINSQDWLEGVESFDILSLLKARPCTSFAASELFVQQKKIVKDSKGLKKILLKDLQKEREIRLKRFDSISNFLEPNLKYGPGGLRDIEQGLQVYELFAEKFEKAEYALRVLRFYKAYFLSLRQKLHVDGFGDILVSSAQHDIAAWCGFDNHKDFMRSIQRGLSRTAFYTNWISAVALSSDKKNQELYRAKLQNEKELWSFLKKDSSILGQKQIRDSLEVCFGSDLNSKSSSNERAKILKELTQGAVSDELITATFQSRLIDKLIPEIVRLVGWSQHDQYHRYPADTHIMQTRRELRRIQLKPRLLGSLENVHKKLKPLDWEILAWTCFYHDLAKGLDGDHSEKGVSLVQRDLKQLGVSDVVIKEVSWLVLNHLEMSQAAFRKNPHDASVWKSLKDKGFDSVRSNRLAVFTVVDIKATNPEAWNDWKSRLLSDLLKNLESEKAQSLYELEFAAKKGRVELPQDWAGQIDTLVVGAIGAKVLVKDLKALLDVREESSLVHTKVFEDSKGSIWIRFYTPNNRVGLLKEFCLLLTSIGLPVRHAAIHTFDGFGVWDWFMVTSNKPKELIAKMIKQTPSHSGLNDIAIQYQSIQWVEINDHEWVLSFKAQDQKGLLTATVSLLSSLGADIRSARVHTWGRQVDDVFSLVPMDNAEKFLNEILSEVQIK